MIMSVYKYTYIYNTMLIYIAKKWKKINKSFWKIKEKGWEKIIIIIKKFD